MRIAAALLAVLGVVLCVAVAGAASERKAQEAPTAFGVVRTTFPGATLYPYVPHEADRPGMTADSPYFTLNCYTADGRRLVSSREPWPTPDDDDHFHAPVRMAVALRLERCRIDGVEQPLVARIVDGPGKGQHPDGLPLDPRTSLDPLGF